MISHLFPWHLIVGGYSTSTFRSAGDSNRTSKRITRHHVPATGIKRMLWLIITGSCADASTDIFPTCRFFARTTATKGRRDMIGHCFPRWCILSRGRNRVSSAFWSAGKAHHRYVHITFYRVATVRVLIKRMKWHICGNGKKKGGQQEPKKKKKIKR